MSEKYSLSPDLDIKQVLSLVERDPMNFGGSNFVHLHTHYVEEEELYLVWHRDGENLIVTYVEEEPDWIMVRSYAQCEGPLALGVMPQEVINKFPEALDIQEEFLFRHSGCEYF